MYQTQDYYNSLLVNKTKRMKVKCNTKLYSVLEPEALQAVKLFKI